MSRTKHRHFKPTPPSLETNAEFDRIVGEMTVVEISGKTKDHPDVRITVLVNMPHLKKYGQQVTRELVYGCDFPVEIGDTVRCPPTPLYKRWSTGVVTALDGKQWRGPVKYVRPLEGGKK